MKNIYQLNKDELKQLKEIENKYYMFPIMEKINNYVSKYGLEETMNYLHEILITSKSEVDLMLEDRKNKGEIKDVSQARKSIVGQIFSNSIVYLFLKNKEFGNVKDKIFITNKTKDKLFENMVTINVGGETQKPDMDLIIYSKNNDDSLNKCMIISLKTSLRERAGQTYKWKLLMEIATTENPIKEKYNIKYEQKVMPLVCFATVNFYNEINNPQHRGMFKFFDNSFIGKPIKSDFISNLSSLLDFANTKLI